MKVIPERFGERGSLPLLARGRGGGDLGNEVVVKRNGCTQAIVEPLCKKSCRREKWGINHSQAFGSWLKVIFRSNKSGYTKTAKVCPTCTIACWRSCSVGCSVQKSGEDRFLFTPVILCGRINDD